MKTVLLIDDDRDFRFVLGQFLTRHGWSVFEAEDGDVGLRLARQHRPAAVLCDLLMPRTNGFQVIAAIRADSSLRNSLIIAISGKGYSTTRQSAFDSGADDFLLKPIHPAELLALLDRMTAPERAVRPETPVSTKAGTRLKFWGVRGSIPTPGPDTVHYGGNTSCVEVRSGEEIIILDAGTGIRALGQALSAEFGERPLSVTILVTHTHWDHVQGFPFFAPAYNPHNHIRILGFEGARESLAGVFSGQMESPYFPIGLAELPGHILIDELKDLEFSLGPVRVQASFVNHPGVCVGYRLETEDGSIAYLPDNEPFYRLRAEPSTQLFFKEAAPEFARMEDQKMIQFLRGADVLIIDAQYDSAEYEVHRGWGHGCVDDVVALALQAEVKKLYLFHHDPDHNDGKVADMLAHARKLVAQQGSALIVEAATEGETVTLNRSPVPSLAP